MPRKFDWFLWGMLLAVILAWLFPSPGARGGWMHPEILTKAGVALIFFLHGVALSFAALKASTLHWRLHLVVQGSTFVIFPLVGLALFKLTETWLLADVRLGFFYLCAVPSTVSTSVALTATAGGNVPAAVFNATLSSLLGVVLTPLWMTAVARTSGDVLPLDKVVLDLVLWLVLPLVVGQLARPILGAWAARNRAKINNIDRLTILLLVYTSFCDSVVLGIWSDHGLMVLAATFIISVVLFFVVFSLVGFICDLLKFSTPDRIATVFCGSKKSLASGVPMAQLMFAQNPSLGLILLPIMVYHPLQLIICGVLASRWAAAATPERNKTPETLINADPH